MQTIYLGKLGPMTISAKPNTFIGMALLWAALAALGYFLLKLSLIEALIGGLIAAVLHVAFELVHQAGHYIMGKRTGYPLKGVRFWWILGSSIYPSDEPELPARIHIQRALGGPIFSGVMALIFGVIAWLLMPTGGVAYYLAVFSFLDNLLFFSLGALLPLGFTDGSSILHHWGKP